MSWNKNGADAHLLLQVVLLYACMHELITSIIHESKPDEDTLIGDDESDVPPAVSTLSSCKTKRRVV